MRWRKRTQVAGATRQQNLALLEAARASKAAWTICDGVVGDSAGS
jgi:hypothetical protein